MLKNHNFTSGKCHLHFTKNFFGVYFNKNELKYQGQITHEKKRYSCGYFTDDEDAAKAVNSKCMELDIPLKNPGIGISDHSKNITKKVPFFFKLYYFDTVFGTF